MSFEATLRKLWEQEQADIEKRREERGLAFMSRAIAKFAKMVEGVGCFALEPVGTSTPSEAFFRCDDVLIRATCPDGRVVFAVSTQCLECGARRWSYGHNDLRSLARALCQEGSDECGCQWASSRTVAEQTLVCLAGVLRDVLELP